jgi:hypothetical protein
MSYYSEIDFNDTSKKESNTITKEKFVSKENPTDIWLSRDKSSVIDRELNLKAPKVSTKSDHKVESSFYYNNKTLEAGRGFGNLNISNDIRYGSASRLDTKEYKEKQESKQMLDFHFQYLDKDYQNPANLILPMPRGGDMTRKQSRTVNISDKRENIEFEY